MIRANEGMIATLLTKPLSGLIALGLAAVTVALAFAEGSWGTTAAHDCGAGTVLSSAGLYNPTCPDRPGAGRYGLPWQSRTLYTLVQVTAAGKPGHAMRDFLPLKT